MSQEGALKMAQSGYFADQIIKFYYPNSFLEKYE
jgi:peptidoglycan hydrolase-like amidase